MLDPHVIKRHAGLLDEMATAQGVDLEAVVMDGSVDVTELENAVLRCAECKQSQDCESRLSRLEAGAGMPLPDYCRNSLLFADISQG